MGEQKEVKQKGFGSYFGKCFGIMFLIAVAAFVLPFIISFIIRINDGNTEKTSLLYIIRIYVPLICIVGSVPVSLIYAAVKSSKKENN